MSNDIPGPDDDFFIDMATAGLLRALSDPAVGDAHTRAGEDLNRVMDDAMACADPEARPIIIGQINVLKVVHDWIAQSVGNPQATMGKLDAVREIQDAIFAGMRGERYV